jgi:pimeloyl-ACP methyl ester carboxylesterase
MTDHPAAPAAPDCPLKPACAVASPEACREDDCAAEHARPPLDLRAALERFEREARWGVCDTGRYRCPYFTWGEGPPLLLIPGMADDARSFVPLGSLLAARFRCIAYDMPTGRGDGARLRRYRHADLVEDALALLDHLAIRQSYVLGSSFGGTVALALLEARPERFPRGILQGSFAHRPLRPGQVRLAWLLRGVPVRARWMPFRRAEVRREHGGPFAGRPADHWDFFLGRWTTPPIRAVARRALLLHRLDLRPLLGRIRQPVLLVYGDRDPLVGGACADELLRGLPNAVRIELTGCGHNPIFTHPEVLADVVGHFLTPPAVV